MNNFVILPVTITNDYTLMTRQVRKQSAMGSRELAPSEIQFRWIRGPSPDPEFMHTPYFLHYDHFKRGIFSYYGYYNPLTLWNN